MENQEKSSTPTPPIPLNAGNNANDKLNVS